MKYEINKVKVGLTLVLLGLLFGLGMGISFGIYEDEFKDYIAEGIIMHASVHADDPKAQDKIWRYAQRSHFHAMGIAATSLGLILLVMMTSLRTKIKSLTATLIGMVNLYPLAWFSMFWLAPSIGRSAAHHHLYTQIFTYVGTLSILLGLGILVMHLYFGAFHEKDEFEDNYRKPI